LAILDVVAQQKIERKKYNELPMRLIRIIVFGVKKDSASAF